MCFSFLVILVSAHCCQEHPLLRGKAVVLAKNKGASVELRASKNSLLKLISGKKKDGEAKIFVREIQPLLGEVEIFRF